MLPLIKQAMTAESPPAIKGKEAEKRLQEGAEENAARSGGNCSGARRRVEGPTNAIRSKTWQLTAMTAQIAPAIKGREAEKRRQEGAEDNAARSGGKCSGAGRADECHSFKNLAADGS